MAPNSNQIYDVMEQKGWHTITSKQLSGLEYNLIIVDEFVSVVFYLITHKGVDALRSYQSDHLVS